MENNNLPASEMEMALVALLNALCDYNNALEVMGRELNTLAVQLYQQINSELTTGQGAKGPEENDQQVSTLKIKLVRSFERTRQIADFVPIKAYCEVSAEIEVADLPDDEIQEYSQALSEIAEAKVEKTLINYRPLCIICKGKGVNLTTKRDERRKKATPSGKS